MLYDALCIRHLTCMCCRRMTVPCLIASHALKTWKCYHHTHVSICLWPWVDAGRMAECLAPRRTLSHNLTIDVYCMWQIVMLCHGMVCFIISCYAMLCYGMVWYDTLCCGMICSDMLRYAMPCCGMLWHAMLWIWCYAVLSCRKLCYVMVCFAMPCYMCYAMACYDTLC